MDALEFLLELRKKNKWYALVFNNNALAGKLVEFAELYYEMKLKNNKLDEQIKVNR